jgi:hypothetical protein
MNPTDDSLERGIRAHLDREAAQVDASAMLNRVRAKATPQSLDRRAWLRWASVGAGATVAASVGAVLFFNPMNPPQLAAAEQLLEEAKTAHTQPTDRCYEVTSEWELPFLRRLQVSAVSKKFRVWTRGERFWVEPLGESVPYVMGQDSTGRIWFALNRKRGLIYEPTEVGEPLARLCELLSLRAVQTLSEILEQFTVLRKDRGQPGETIQIEAKIRPSWLNRNPRFREISIELDPTTKLIQKAEFKRQINDEPAALLAFRLLESGTQPDAAYEVTGHLDADAEVWDHKDPTRQDRRAKFRDEFLKRFQNRMGK